MEKGAAPFSCCHLPRNSKQTVMRESQQEHLLTNGRQIWTGSPPATPLRNVFWYAAVQGHLPLPSDAACRTAHRARERGVVVTPDAKLCYCKVKNEVIQFIKLKKV